jgi:hypothetical protein
MSRQRSCEKCEFYENVGPDFGFCRRFPPKPIEEGVQVDSPSGWSFPLVHSSDWCGEYRVDHAKKAAAERAAKPTPPS